MICVICNHGTDKSVLKGAIQYYKCSNCQSIFCEPLDQENKIGGQFEIERNEKENHIRIARIDKACENIPKEEVRILDFGAGTGYLIQDLKKYGYTHVDGFDAYSEQYCRLPAKEQYHIIICVETAEHFSAPFMEFDLMHRSLVTNGVVLLETGYLDATREDGIKDEDNPYINPDAGHSMIYTHHCMDLLMCMKGFRPRQKFGRHCLFYQKVAR